MVIFRLCRLHQQKSLKPFTLVKQNIGNWITYKELKSFFPVLEAGKSKIKWQVVAFRGRILFLSFLKLHPKKAEVTEEQTVVL